MPISNFFHSYNIIFNFLNEGTFKVHSVIRERNYPNDNVDNERYNREKKLNYVRRFSELK